MIMVMPLKQLFFSCSVRRNAYNKNTTVLKAAGAFPVDIKRGLEMSIESQMAEMLLLLCFGILSPLLGVIIATRIAVGCYVSELVLGRFLVRELSVVEFYKTKIEKSAPVKFKCLARSRGNDVYLSEKTLITVAIEAADATKPWGAVRAMQDLQLDCSHLPLSVFALTGNVYALVMSVVLAFLTNDIYNGQGEKQAYPLYPLIVMCSFPVVVMFVMYIWPKVKSPEAVAGEPSVDTVNPLGVHAFPSERAAGEDATATDAANFSVEHPTIGVELVDTKQWNYSRELSLPNVHDADDRESIFGLSMSALDALDALDTLDAAI